MNEEDRTAELKNGSSDGADLTLESKGDLAHILTADGKGQGTMQGFDPQFADIVDYIIKVTHQIWEDRGIGKLYDYYGTNIRVHTSEGEVYSREKVIESTIQSLAAFPNRRLYGDEVIWSGNDDEGYFTSHRLTHEGHNWGHTAFGPPTGKKVSYRAIADCRIANNVIVEEWLARDNAILLMQLGFDVHEVAQRLAEEEPSYSLPQAVPAEPDRLRGQLAPVTYTDDTGSDIEDFVRRALHEIWNWRLLNKIKSYFVPRIICHSASGRQLFGQNQYAHYVLSLLAPFPDLALSVDHFCFLKDGQNRYRTATRWTMAGTHTGPGNYGTPTGNQMRIMGISHHLIEDGRFVQEWTVFDEFALLKQLYRR